MIRSIAWSLAALVCALPAQVLACPVCSADKDDAARQAFFDTTVFLTLLPVAMFGAIVYWIVKRVQANQASELDSVGDVPGGVTPERTPELTVSELSVDVRA